MRRTGVRLALLRRAERAPQWWPSLQLAALWMRCRRPACQPRRPRPRPRCRRQLRSCHPAAPSGAGAVVVAARHLAARTAVAAAVLTVARTAAAVGTATAVRMAAADMAADMAAGVVGAAGTVGTAVAVALVYQRRAFLALAKPLTCSAAGYPLAWLCVGVSVVRVQCCHSAAAVAAVPMHV